MPIVESFATIISLASAFSTGRDINQNTSLIEFQSWLVESGHKNLSEDIANSHATGIYIKALLNQQLPLIIEAINELKDQSLNLPVNIQSLLNVKSDVLLQAIDNLERKTQSADKTQVNQQTSSGNRAPNVVHHGSGNISVNTGDTIDTQINHYGISIADHKKALEEREREIREELFKTSTSDRLYRELLEKEYSAIKEKLVYLEQSYQEELDSRAEAEKALEEIQNSLPSCQADVALKKLREGDKEAAKELFDNVIGQVEEHCELASRAAYENGQIAKAEIRLTEAKKYFEKAVRFQPDNAKFNNALGSILHYLGQYEKAIQFHQIALAYDLNAYGEDHPSVARDRNNLGSAYHSLGQYDKAIEYYQLALTSDLKTYCENHPEVARDRNNLGLAYHSIGKLEDAIEYLQLALVSAEKNEERDDPQVALYHNNLSLVYQTLGRFDKAVEYQQLALASDLKTFGEGHPAVAVRHNNLATTYLNLGHFDKAIEYWQIALDSDLKNYGENHPQVAIYRSNLGVAYKNLGQFEKAIGLYNLALASDLRTFGESHPCVARDRNNLGGVYRSLGQTDKAIELYQLALASDLKTFGEDHPLVALYNNNIGESYGCLGQYVKAIECYQRALHIYEETFGKQHYLTQLVAENLLLAQEQSNTSESIC